MRTNTVKAPAMWSASAPAEEAPPTASRGDRGRRAILAGWLVTMLGIALYIAAMSRAGEHADIADALVHQGPLGWSAAALMLAGVVMWFVGNFACLQDLTVISRAVDDE